MTPTMPIDPPDAQALDVQAAPDEQQAPAAEPQAAEPQPSLQEVIDSMSEIQRGLVGFALAHEGLRTTVPEIKKDSDVVAFVKYAVVLAEQARDGGFALTVDDLTKRAIQDVFGEKVDGPDRANMTTYQTARPEAREALAGITALLNGLVVTKAPAAGRQIVR